MTGTTLKQLTTDLLGGAELGDTLFYQLLNIAKNNREGLRPWIILRAEDSEETASSGDTFETMKDLPSDFRRTLTRDTMVLRAGESILRYTQIPFSSRQIDRKRNQVFYIDLANSQYALCGSVSKTHVIYLYYIKKSTDIEEATEWVFPSEYHPILAFDVAVMHKGGIDFDDINARMAQYNGLDARMIERMMIKWDNEMQLAEQQGVENY